MRTGLCAGPGGDVLLNLLPFSPIKAKGFEKAVMLFLLPAAYIHMA